MPTLINSYISGKQKPFRIGVRFDKQEVCTAAATNTCEYDLAAATMPGGTTGFKLTYNQVAC